MTAKIDKNNGIGHGPQTPPKRPDNNGASKENKPASSEVSRGRRESSSPVKNDTAAVRVRTSENPRIANNQVAQKLGPHIEGQAPRGLSLKAQLQNDTFFTVRTSKEAHIVSNEAAQKISSHLGDHRITARLVDSASSKLDENRVKKLLDEN